MLENRNARIIAHRLSLRPPQKEALAILSELAGILGLRKNAELSAELERVKELYKTCTDFERTFPSLCFALATGVGKTRLMGAFIAWLYKEKNMRNFFVLAPNLTVYTKLIEDFSDRHSPKYVFPGIDDFAHIKPRIITGDNYDAVRDNALFKDEVHINVFNISKINQETRKGSAPRIKRLSEYLGESYFDYLAQLEDLVLLMDESHHYRADRGMQVLNELQPALGLELTATPQTERGGRSVKFKNVVYEYSLARAIEDGFVKEPAVATRRDFDPAAYSAAEIDRIKLEDGIRLHEDTKVALDLYARNSGGERVKPFVLVVAKDTKHANDLHGLIASEGFFEGRYADKVMEIHSNTRGGEKDENIARLVSLEDTANRVEIVIHVNMLKEGWDVTNLYTIIPLRSAASTTLREQTIGRGLRLPYGRRTGVSKVDKLTIVAHDKFQEIIEAANRSDSIIRRANIITIEDGDEALEHKEVISSPTLLEERLESERAGLEEIADPRQREEACAKLEARTLILESLPELSRKAKSLKDLNSAEIKRHALENIERRLENESQKMLFGDQLVKDAAALYEVTVNDYTAQTIEIPRISVQPDGEARVGFHDFDLDTATLRFQPVSEEILVRSLREHRDEIVIGRGRIVLEEPARLIVGELMNFAEVDYDAQRHLLFKLARQAVAHFGAYLNKAEVLNVTQYHRREIGRFIYTQLMEHFYYEPPEFRNPEVLPFTKILQHNYTKFSADDIHTFTETITPASAIPRKVFSGFRKACHRLYKFDSRPEKDLAFLLEQDEDALKWLRPAPNQFHIYWYHNSRQYLPDFVAECRSVIYLIEIKRDDELESEETQDKARAALHYCKHAGEYALKHGGKPWSYALIPASAVRMNMRFTTLAENYRRMF